MFENKNVQMAVGVGVALLLVAGLVFALATPEEEPVPRSGYQTNVYTEQGGDKLVVASGGEIEVQSGATMDVQSGATVGLAGGTINGNQTITGNLTVNGTASWGCSDTTIENDLTISDTLTANAGVFTDTVDVSGAATLNSTLDVDGATTLNSTLDVDGNISSGTGAVTVTDSVNITGAVDCDSTLNVDGAVTVDSLVVDNGSITLENSETISNSTDGDVFVNGELLYRTNVISQSADYTVQAADSGSLIITTGAGEATTHTLPTAAAGLSYCWYVGEAYSLTLDAAAGDTILHLTDGAGQRAQNATEGDSVCLYGQTSLWIPMHEVGTWEDIN